MKGKENRQQNSQHISAAQPADRFIQRSLLVQSGGCMEAGEDKLMSSGQCLVQHDFFFVLFFNGKEHFSYFQHSLFIYSLIRRNICTGISQHKPSRPLSVHQVLHHSEIKDGTFGQDFFLFTQIFPVITIWHTFLPQKNKYILCTYHTVQALMTSGLGVSQS